MPEALAEGLRSRLIWREMWEVQHCRLLSQVLAELDRAGLQPLLMKGTALAYSHYGNPAVRARVDSDILICEGGRRRAAKALGWIGCATSLIPGDTGISEQIFMLNDLSGKSHDFDLHWRLNNAAVIAQLFDHRDLFDRSLAVPELGPHARRLSDLDALLYACVHRRFHLLADARPGQPPLEKYIWLLDIKHLYEGLTVSEKSDFVALSVGNGIAGICAEALRSCRDFLRLDVNHGTLTTLDAQETGEIEKYLNASYLQKHLMNLRHQTGLSGKMRYLLEVLFPHPDFLRERFATGRLDIAPMLYLRRLVQGFRILMSGRGS